jgi:hypothetical protein
LVSQWWIDIDAARHSVLDGAPSYGSKNAGWADLLLCDLEQPVCVVEVEGTQALKKVSCIASYFQSHRTELASLELGLLLLYAYEAKGAGASRKYPSPECPDIVASIKDVTARSRQAFFLVLAEKQYERLADGIRSTSGYYQGAVNRVTAICFEKGEETLRRTLWEPTPSRA